MDRKTMVYLKSAAVGAAVGGVAFCAVRSLTSKKRMRRKTVAKAMRVVGGIMDSL